MYVFVRQLFFQNLKGHLPNTIALPFYLSPYFISNFKQKYFNVISAFRIKNRRTTRIAARQSISQAVLKVFDVLFKSQFISEKLAQLTKDRIFCKPNRIIQSTSAKNTAAKADSANTITVVSSTSLRVGHVIFDTSDRTCWINLKGFVVAIFQYFLSS